ncbi:MAG: hypothetical protein KKF46_02340 [Nanoarchaeota archaeon]|nr:hypothetical protein [Nanoarchaeota archaeon]MBU1321171.1 hypothetical protein [Nanoarchaeota archaeon]MBU1598327.1 hypothetical protein [Nanoarchaeota archaeon]MBU2442289.1 hypothetical protein [Nanoarchaeota archaeon]
MKHEIDILNKTYDVCLANGRFKEKNTIDLELIKSLKEVAEKGLEFIKQKSSDIKRNSTDWTFVFRDYYESLRGLIEAVLLFDRTEADSHQCKNAYICTKHPEMELDWDFLETIRLKRNAINYRGQLLKYDDWSKLKIQFELHIKILMRELDNRLK